MSAPPVGGPALAPPAGVQLLAGGTWLGQMDGDPTVYVIAGGARFIILTPAELYDLGYDWSQVTHVPAHALDGYGQIPQQFTLLRERDDPTVWLMSAGAALMIPTPEALADLHLDWASVGILPSGAVARNGIAKRRLPSMSVTPGSMMFGPNGDGSAPGIRWPRSEAPGFPLPNTNQVVELRGWLTGVPGELNASDPDYHYGLIVDADWLITHGFDLRTFVLVGDIVGRAWGADDAHNAVYEPGLGIEINGLPMDLGWQQSSRVLAWPADWVSVDALVTQPYPQAYWPYQLPVAAQNGDYVRVCGSLVTDPAHIGSPGASAAYNDAMTIWQAAEGHTSPTNPARWTEMHPPDAIQRVADLDPADQSAPGTSNLIGVAVVCQSSLISPVEVFNEITTDLRPTASQPPGTVAHVEEYVGPETLISSIVEGNAAGEGAAITVYPDRVTVHVKVRGEPFHGAPGKFKAVYRLSWVPSATQVVVPDVTRQSLTDAATTLDSAGLTWSVVQTETGGEQPTVIAQTPPADTLVAHGARIGLTVLQPSTGPQP